MVKLAMRTAAAVGVLFLVVVAASSGEWLGGMDSWMYVCVRASGFRAIIIGR